jgi:uncharacterized membrane protein
LGLGVGFLNISGDVNRFSFSLSFQLQLAFQLHSLSQHSQFVIRYVKEIETLASSSTLYSFAAGVMDTGMRYHVQKFGRRFVSSFKGSKMLKILEDGSLIIAQCPRSCDF